MLRTTSETLLLPGNFDFLQGNSAYTVNPIHQKKIRGV